MKKALIIVLLLSVTVMFSQNKVNPKFEKKGDKTEATFYHENGKIEQQGFFNKNNKLEGVWTSFDNTGKKTAIGNYKNGKKVGKWFFWTKNSLKEVDYNSNAITDVSEWKDESKIAVRDKP
ncbi:toxin-antitoxin system YwqK family antitoxin [Lacinutrix salivirga]